MVPCLVSPQVFPVQRERLSPVPLGRLWRQHQQLSLQTELSLHLPATTSPDTSRVFPAS